jgi:hypothetical protein
MDAAVGLVQAYLRVNGFFTVTEYPVVAETSHGGMTLTDVDVLAVRFPGAQRWVPERGREGQALPTDPELSSADDGLDMIIGEVKEGEARLNRGAYALPVVETVIRRFGCCARDPAATARAVVEGRAAETVVGGGMHCRIRMIVFAGSEAEVTSRYRVIPLRHVFTFLSDHLNRNREVFLRTQIKDEAMDLMALLAKVGLRVGP